MCAGRLSIQILRDDGSDRETEGASCQRPLASSSPPVAESSHWTRRRVCENGNVLTCGSDPGSIVG